MRDRVLGLIREQSGIWCYEVTSNNTVYERKLLHNRLISRLIVLGSLIVITIFSFFFLFLHVPLSCYIQLPFHKNVMRPISFSFSFFVYFITDL